MSQSNERSSQITKPSRSETPSYKSDKLLLVRAVSPCNNEIEKKTLFESKKKIFELRLDDKDIIIHQKNKEIERLYKMGQDLELQLYTISSENSKLKNLLNNNANSSSNQEVMRIQNEYRQVVSINKELSKQIGEILAQKKIEQNHIFLISSKIKQQNEEIINLKNRNEALQKLQESYEVQKKENQNMYHQVLDLKEHISVIKKEKDELLSQINILNSKFQDQNKIISCLAADHNNYIAYKDKSEIYETSIQKLTQENKELVNLVNQLKGYQTQLDQKLFASEKKVHEKEQQFLFLIGENTHLKELRATGFDQLKEVILQKEDQINNLRAELAKFHNSDSICDNSLTSRLQLQEQLIIKLKKENEELNHSKKADLVKFQGAISQIEDELNLWKTQNSKANSMSIDVNSIFAAKITEQENTLHMLREENKLHKEAKEKEFYKFQQIIAEKNEEILHLQNQSQQQNSHGIDMEEMKKKLISIESQMNNLIIMYKAIDEENKTLKSALTQAQKLNAELQLKMRES